MASGRVARLPYIAIASLDGYVADEGGDCGWAAPDEDVHAFVNDLERPVGTYLDGRRMYEVMAGRQEMPLEGASPAVRDFRGALAGRGQGGLLGHAGRGAHPRTRLEPRFDPDAVRRLKASAGRDITVGGPRPAARAWAAGLVDECHLLPCPALVGGGTRALPDGMRAALELVGERRLAGGAVHLHHRVVARG